MPTNTGNRLSADVRTSEILDGIAIVPRDRRQRLPLLRELRSRYPAIAWRDSSTGIFVPANQAHLITTFGAVCDMHWTDEASRFVANRQAARFIHPWMQEHNSALLSAGPVMAKQLLARHRQRLGALDDHQWLNVAAMTLRESFGMCVFDEQGAGKTVTFIHAFDVLFAEDLVDFALIVAPKSMVPEWKEDFHRFMGDLYGVHIVAGDRLSKARELASGADVLITNFETAVVMEDQIRALLRHYERRAVLVVDESFFIKNLNAKRTRAVRRIREYCGRAFVLCGTPAPNAPHDLVQQFNLVDYGITFDGVDIPDEPALAQPIIQQAIITSRLHIRHLKADVLPNLPGKRFSRLLVQLNPVQQRLYQSALDGMILDLQALDEHAFGRQITSFLARRSALLQICSNPGRLVQGYRETPAKLEILDDLLGAIIRDSGQKVVLWSFYTHSVSTICERYGEYHPVRYDGTITSVGERRRAIQQFQSDNRTMLFVGNPAAAGTGITLHRSHVAIYESMSNQAAHYLQSLDRIHRRGQISNVEYIVLLSEGTIEVAEYDRLMQKERAGHQLLRDVEAERVTRDVLLSELEDARQLFGETYATDTGAIRMPSRT